MPPVEQDALIYGPIRVELLQQNKRASEQFQKECKGECR